MANYQEEDGLYNKLTGKVLKSVNYNAVNFTEYLDQ